ncbi:MAG TPA: alpha/beta fold hydrolase, partial [Polyangiaceae bacterium]|nr:alpha/beta fold hydrolase [Polyangiaceae bacterium]
MNVTIEWQSEPARRVRANDVELAYWDTGEGVPVLTLHGFPTSRRVWRHQLALWAQAGYRVVAPDLPGFGQSERPLELAAYRIERVGAALLALLDSLDITKCHLVGHDWGAALTWWLSTSCPERVLRHVSLSVGHPAYLRAPSLEQRRRLWYALLFQFDGLAEAALISRDWALFREHVGGHAESAHWLADLARPGALTAALNWYRANL